MNYEHLFVKGKKNMKTKKIFLASLLLIALVFGFGITPGQSVPLLSISSNIDWWPLPPYNTLWPLWSPLQSPPNILGIPQPLVSSLTPDTILPVQPALTWDPNLDYPWLLYNTPSGMVYYDPIFGIDLWPPDYLVSPWGLPLPINLALIPGWSTLAPTSAAWLTTNIPIANNAYYSSYSQYAPLLDPGTLLGLTLLP